MKLTIPKEKSSPLETIMEISSRSSEAVKKVIRIGVHPFSLLTECSKQSTAVCSCVRVFGCSGFCVFVLILDKMRVEDRPEGSERAGASTMSQQFGAERLDFWVVGCRAFLIEPTQPTPDGSKPWLFFAPTFMGEHPTDPDMNPSKNIHPADADTPINLPVDRPDRATNAWLFTRLLTNGFHICGIEVGESMGNPKGRRQFTDFHHFLQTNYKLSAKACLYAQSRGGLMLYNWAAEHPEWVQCIGGNQPVCDLKSYPGLQKASRHYGMSVDELRENLQKHNPIDRLAPLADRDVPILHIHGDADRLVPLEPNTMELARRYRALGKELEVIIVRGVGHGRWPELFDDPRMLDFFLTHTDLAKRAGNC